MAQGTTLQTLYAANGNALTVSLANGNYEVAVKDMAMAKQLKEILKTLETMERTLEVKRD